MQNALLKEVLEYKRKIRLTAQLDAKSRAEQLYASIPRLAKIDGEMAANSALAAVSAVGGETNSVKLYKVKNDELKKERLNYLNNLDVSEDYLLPIYTCAKCEDDGYFNGEICDCVKKLVTEKKLLKLNKESSLSLSTFESFDINFYNNNDQSRMGLILLSCKNYVNEFTGCENMMFMGATGLGKTHLSMAIASSLIAKGHDVIYASTQELFNIIEKEKFSINKTDNDKLDTILNCRLLILDDLGSEFATSFTQSLVYTIVNSRLNKSLATIISTNHSLDELQKKYTDRVLSRISGNYTMKQFVGEDIRAKIKLNNRNK